LLIYGSYWVTREHSTEQVNPYPVGILKQRVEVPTIGISDQMRESVMLKAQFAPVDIELRVPSWGLEHEVEFDRLSAAVSVVF